MTMISAGVGAGDAQVHALVIGVGTYSHLDQGRAAEFGLDARLTSPPRSATAFARFLVEELRAPVPLGSVDLWLSGADTFESDATGRIANIGNPTMDNVSQAIRAWAARARAREDNIAIFYFCGHGIAKGAEVGLLCSDFGSQPNPLLQSIDITALHGAMANERNPSQQIFVIDACRQPSLQAMRQHGAVGVDLLGWETDFHAAEDSAIFFATLPTSPSYGTTGDVSLFTKAVLRALRGLGAQFRGTRRWEVSTENLQRGIKAAMKADTEGWRLGQRPQLGGWTGERPLHRLEDPGAIPLSISVPHAPVSYVELRRDGDVTRVEPPEELRLALPAADYVGRAGFADAHWTLEEQPVRLWPPEADLVWEAAWQS